MQRDPKSNHAAKLLRHTLTKQQWAKKKSFYEIFSDSR